MTIAWVFFDIGSVLMDESAWNAHVRQRLLETLEARVPGVTRTCLEQEWVRGGARPDVIPSQHVLERFIPDPVERRALRRHEWQTAPDVYYRLGVPVDGAEAVLASLQTRYRLGVLANQHPPIRAWMDRTGLSRFFRLYAYDWEVGCSKPAPGLFRWALAQAACPAAQAVMVGDRLDNDIAPARALGMWTVRVQALGEYARMEPTGPADRPDRTVSTLRAVPEALAALERQSLAVGLSGEITSGTASNRSGTGRSPEGTERADFRPDPSRPSR